MNSDKQLEEFLSQWVEPAPHPTPKARKPAAEIMVSGFVRSVGPRLVYSRNGKKRWETRVQTRPDLGRVNQQYPGNFA